MRRYYGFRKEIYEISVFTDFTFEMFQRGTPSGKGPMVKSQSILYVPGINSSGRSSGTATNPHLASYGHKHVPKPYGNQERYRRMRVDMGIFPLHSFEMNNNVKESIITDLWKLLYLLIMAAQVAHDARVV
jgi:hypothetical protein